MRSYPVLPIALGALGQAASAVAGTVASGLKAFGRAWQNRRQAQALARLEPRMLADMGINHADLRDAFSSPLWEDPTELLQERAAERRCNRSAGVTSIAPVIGSEAGAPPAGTGFRVQSLTRPARAMI
jgi:uncharacterized protein YjiS (DUF1127 family)